MLIAMIQEIWHTEGMARVQSNADTKSRRSEAPKQLPTPRIVENQRKTAKHHHHEKN